MKRIKGKSLVREAYSTSVVSAYDPKIAPDIAGICFKKQVSKRF